MRHRRSACATSRGEAPRTLSVAFRSVLPFRDAPCVCFNGRENRGRGRPVSAARHVTVIHRPLSSHVIVTVIHRQLSFHVACDLRDPPQQQPTCAPKPPPTARTPAPRQYVGWPRPGLYPDADEALYRAHYEALYRALYPDADEALYRAHYEALYRALYPDADEALSARGEPFSARYGASRLLRGVAYALPRWGRGCAPC
jgi:hypothetical protein